MKSLNLAGLLEYFAAHHQRPVLNPKSFPRHFATCTVLRAGAGAAGEQAADHSGGELGEADTHQLNPPASRPRPRPGVQARVLPSSTGSE